MSNVRVFSSVFLILVLFQAIAAKPILSLLWCTLFCDDDSTDPEDDDAFCGCRPNPQNRPDVTIRSSLNEINLRQANGNLQINLSPPNTTSTQRPLVVHLNG